MGCGSWSDKAFTSYSTSMGRSVDLTTGRVTGSYTAQQMFKSSKLHESLNPYKVTRECCDTDEHPNTVPVILALDVTGSMGDASVEVAKTLNAVITELYKDVKDLEIMIMGIGDMSYDNVPLQVTQFESDIRIAEQLDRLYFEFGGGGNDYESYSLAWYFALNHTKIDAIDKRGKKAIIITMGDETLNPYIPNNGYQSSFELAIGDKLQGDIDTKQLYRDAKDKFDIYHIHVDHTSRPHNSFDHCKESFIEILGEDHVYQSNLNSIASVIIDIVTKASKNQEETFVSTESYSSDPGLTKTESGEIVW